MKWLKQILGIIIGSFGIWSIECCEMINIHSFILDLLTNTIGVGLIILGVGLYIDRFWGCMFRREVK